MQTLREQIELGLIEVLKIKSELNNNADLHAKKLRDKSFAVKADDNILGSHAALYTSDSEAGTDLDDE